MKLSKHRRDHALGFNVTPMIDVVFLLLIFFMTVSQISKNNRQLLQLPEVGKIVTAEHTVQVTINMDQAGSLTIAGQTVSIDQVMVRLREQIVAASGDPSRLHLLLRCDRRCPMREVDRFLGPLRDLRLGEIRTAVSD